MEPDEIDDILDKMEYGRIRRQQIAAEHRGKGVYEDKPEQPHYSSAQARFKLGDYEKGYFGKKDS